MINRTLGNVLAALAAACLLSACSAPALRPLNEYGVNTATPSPAASDIRYEKCVKGATDDYRVDYGEQHYRDNETAVNRLIAQRCELARK